jgi:hypothetical protein
MEHLLLSFKGGSKITALHRILLLLCAIEKAIQLSHTPPRLFSNAAAALQFNLMIYCKELHFLPGRLIILI